MIRPSKSVITIVINVPAHHLLSGCTTPSAADIPPPPTAVKTPSAPLRHRTRDGQRADPTTAQPARGTTELEATRDGGARTKTRGVGSGSGVDGSERHETKRVSSRLDGETSQFTV